MHPHSPGKDQAFRRLLTQQVEHAGALLEALRAEQTALSDQALDDIQQLTVEKQRLVAAIEDGHHQLHEVLTGLGVSTSGQEVEAWILSSAELSDLLPEWQRFTALLGDCHHQNTINGAAIEAARQSLERVLDVMHNASGSGTLYDPSGKAERVKPSRYATRA